MNSLLPREEMIRAIENRDRSYAGLFVVAVKSTGIFCRPGCPARMPMRKQMVFFPGPRQALKAGYRPCKRCKPTAVTEPLPPLVEQLKQLIDENPLKRVTQKDLQAIGIDPSTARRQFQRYYGMSFHNYQRSLKLGGALQAIREGETVLSAGFDAGYDSSSGFRDAFKELFGAAPSAARSADCLLTTMFETPLGSMIAIADDKALHLLEFVDRRRLVTEIAMIRKQVRSVVVPGSNEVLRACENEIREYFAGERTRFTIKLRPAGTAFEQSVWDQLLKIPYGTTLSYGELGERLGQKNAARAVGRANGANKLAIVIPCHRVIKADGNLSGYGGGVWRKKWLLEHEAAQRSLLR